MFTCLRKCTLHSSAIRFSMFRADVTSAEIFGAVSVEPIGIEPTTSGLQSQRSPN
jgi:hypothetical protein